MTKKPSIPRERVAALQKSYDQLCMWLNYDASSKQHVRHLLDHEYVRPFFREYRRDFLEVVKNQGHRPGAISFEDLFDLCTSAKAFTQHKYVASAKQVNKKDWSARDHAARFVVRVLRHSWENDGDWTCGKFDPDTDEDGENELELYQVWAILQYLQAEWEAANSEDWEVERLGRMFTESLGSRL
ncbi:hypothetical protein F5Y16DRAFT_400581 [Xylariaceae sp. FL0255]|nr:hypothetical protein F5Y16DRAFT_400581 [Xylariaceae sp. FL0255]